MRLLSQMESGAWHSPIVDKNRAFYAQNPSMSDIEMLQQQFFYNAANCSAFIDLPYRWT